MKTTYFIKIAFLLLFPFLTIGQTNEKFVPVFDASRQVMIYQNNEVIIIFKLKANETQISGCRNGFEKKSKTSTLVISENKDAGGYYTFTVTSKKQKNADFDKQYFVKVLMAMGMENFSYKNKEYYVEKFMEIIK